MQNQPREGFFVSWDDAVAAPTQFPAGTVFSLVYPPQGDLKENKHGIYPSEADLRWLNLFRDSLVACTRNRPLGVTVVGYSSIAPVTKDGVFDQNVSDCFNLRKAMDNGQELWKLRPHPIFCRGHSGGRLMCEAFIRNGISMGDVSPMQKDTRWFAATNPAVHQLVMNSMRYPQLPEAERAVWQEYTRECIADYVRNQILGPGPFGWKMGFTLFMMPMVLDAFPDARVVHLIRDGRDVMLSRLNIRMDFSSALNRLVVFGDTEINTWRGRPLSVETIAAHRNELEIQHWVTAVQFGLRGRAYGDRYLEVRYEDICTDPITQFERVFNFLDMPFLAQTRAWLSQRVYATRVGKWRRLPQAEIEDALEIGSDLLKQLGYE